MRNRSEMPPAFAKRLRRCVADALIPYGDPNKRVSQASANTYIDRAIDKAGVENLAALTTDAEVLALLCPVIVALVDEDERAIAKIVEITDWRRTMKEVVGVSVKRHGMGVDGFGHDIEDYCVEAVRLLLNRRRHYPYYKGLTLSKFLVRTADNLRDHARKLGARQGRRLSIVPQHPGPAASDECFEEQLPSQLPSTEEHMIAQAELELFMASLKDAGLRAYAEHRAINPDASARDDATTLDITVKKVNLLHRRLGRHISAWNRRSEANLKTPAATRGRK
jgi:hypothetical protein